MNAGTLRRRVYQTLDQGMVGDRLAVAVHRVLLALILVNVGAVILESVPSLAARYGTLFLTFEFVSVGIFTIEYLLRLWACVEHAPLAGREPWRARLVHAATPAMVIDLLAILPFFLAFVVHADLRVVLLLRLLRFFKLARYSPGIVSLVDAVRAERRSLGACLVIFIGALIISSSAMHLAEHVAQPDRFGSIPDAMWWAVITLTTVGYGDVVPITPLGKIIASLTAILGLVMLALPGGIIASAFAREIQRRDFVVTWSMVARVPLFAGLDASSVAEIMRSLKSATYEPGALICRRGDPAHSMYFVAEGEVSVELPDRRATLVAGQFFGEIAVLQRAERSATIRARGRVKLLALDSDDLRHLMAVHPTIATVIKRVAHDRLADDRLGKGGDLVLEELSPSAGEPR
ncbi:MAG: cyclic nucleotide-gated ion channel [Alphaproteobacteria bacterium]